MANWDVLNKKFDELIDNMSTEDWKLWAENRENRKKMRSLEMILKAKLQEEKISLSSNDAKSIISDTSNSEIYSDNKFLNTPVVTPCAGENDYALAA